MGAMKKPKLIIIRGLPGAGKSTLAKSLTRYIHFEADMFWGDPYVFDRDRLSEAHEWCETRVAKTLEDLITNPRDDIDGVVVSNTFTATWEMSAYFTTAMFLDLEMPQVILVQGDYGSIHGVPDEVVERMRSRLMYDVSLLQNDFRAITKTA